jgi:hypothetical protein
MTGYRWAIVKILNLPIIPAQLGYADRAAVGRVEPYRSPPVRT